MFIGTDFPQQCSTQKRSNQIFYAKLANIVQIRFHMMISRLSVLQLGNINENSLFVTVLSLIYNQIEIETQPLI